MLKELKKDILLNENKRQILYDSTYIRYLGVVKCTETKIGGCQGLERGEIGGVTV